MSFPYLETVVAFALVMLVAALMVNIVVRVLYTLRGDRSTGVADMLLQLHRGFVAARDLDLHGQAQTDAENAFVDAVMLSPVLHDVKTWNQVEADYQRAMAKADRVRESDAKKARAMVDKARATRRARLRRQIEHIRLRDLLAIVRNKSEPVPGLPRVRVLPADWVSGVHQVTEPPTIVQQRRFGFHERAEPLGVNARDFHDYITRWFSAAEATASSVFGAEQRKTARAVAGVVVILLNLDAIHLAYGLYQDRALSDRLVTHVGEVVDMAKQLGQTPGATPGSATTPQPTSEQLKQDLQKSIAILTVEHVPIGWQDSYISKRWCAFKHSCDDPTIPVPSNSRMALDLLLWVVGLLSSWALVSLGAPFWVKLIERIPGFGNLLAKPSEDTQKAEHDAWTDEGQQLRDGYASSDTEAGALPPSDG